METSRRSRCSQERNPGGPELSQARGDVGSKSRSGHLVNGSKSEGTLSLSGIRLLYSVFSAHGLNTYEVFGLSQSSGSVERRFFRLHLAIVCAETCGGGRCHGPSRLARALAEMNLQTHSYRHSPSIHHHELRR